MLWAVLIDCNVLVTLYTHQVVRGIMYLVRCYLCSYQTYEVFIQVALFCVTGRHMK